MIYKFLLTALLGVVFSSCLKAQATDAKTPKRAIICLTYDDGLDSHLSTVLPQLDSLGLKATFFLNSIRGSSNVVGEVSKELVGWRTAASHGHELGNHTLFHPCPATLGFARAFAIDTYTVAQLVNEITAQNSVLALIDPARKNRSFAFPCNNTRVENKDYSALIHEKGLVKFARAGGDRNSITTDFKNVNTMLVPSWLVEEGTTLKELIEFAEKARKTDGLAIYQFHGVGAEFFKISTETHRAFLTYLKNHQDSYRVIPFSDAMEAVIAR